MIRTPSAHPLLGLLLLLGLGTAGPVSAQTVTASVDSSESVIHYTGSAPMHDWTGTSHDIRGVFALDLDAPTQSRVRIRARVASFDSGTNRRDRTMRDVTEADRYPWVEFRTTEIRPRHWGKTGSGHAGIWSVTGALTFHGETHSVDASVEVRVDGDRIHADAAFPVSLTRFGVRRPRLLGLTPIADTIRIEAQVVGTPISAEAAEARLSSATADSSSTASSPDDGS